jgi:hypothetical protein
VTLIQIPFAHPRKERAISRAKMWAILKIFTRIRNRVEAYPRSMVRDNLPRFNPDH